jgi:hypothetical protein
MDVRRVLLIFSIGIFLILWGTPKSQAQDGNAVGSSVRSADKNLPMNEVEVTVVQDRRIQDKTRGDDGVYTLKVPTSLTEFDILYHKDGYLDSMDLGIQNSQPQQKRPIARMTSVSALGLLPNSDLQNLINSSIAAIKRGKNKGSTPLVESGKKNLELLRSHIQQTPENMELRGLIDKGLKDVGV